MKGWLKIIAWIGFIAAAACSPVPASVTEQGQTLTSPDGGGSDGPGGRPDAISHELDAFPPQQGSGPIILCCLPLPSDLPAPVTQVVANNSCRPFLETDVSCGSLSGIMAVVVDAPPSSQTCQITVHLSDGETLVATVGEPGGCPPFNNPVDASTFTYVDAGSSVP